MLSPSAFCGFAVIVLFKFADSIQNNQCPHHKIHCLLRNTCVPRFEFTCGPRNCSTGTTLCGSLPQHGEPLQCTPGVGCSGGNSSRPLHPGKGDGQPGSIWNGPVNPEHCNASRRDRDDNPFLSREASDDEKQFNRSGFRRVFSETKFKKMLRKAFNHSILNAPENLANELFGFEKDSSRDWCGRRYSSCVQNAVDVFLKLKSLDGKCCMMAENPEKFAQKLSNISREFRCPRGKRFCAFRFIFQGDGCIPVGTSCSAGFVNRTGDRNTSEPRWSPSGTKSCQGYKYCEMFEANIPERMPCSYPALIKWMASKNDSRSPYGKTCPKGSRFCLSTFDCRPKGQGCGSQELIDWGSKIFCKRNQRLCVGCGIHCRSKQEKCPTAVNMSVELRKAALRLEPGNISDEALRNLTKSGWAPFCLLRKTLLVRVLKELRLCMAREAHCRKNGHSEHKTCVQGEEFCQKLSCFSRSFSTNNHRLCHLLKTNPVKFEEMVGNGWRKTPWGGQCCHGEVFCPIAMRCVPKDRISECKAGQQVCKAGLTRPPWMMNKTRENGERFCCLFMSSAPNGSCSFDTMLQWLARDNKTCSPFGKCCKNGRIFSLSEMKCVNPNHRNLTLEPNDTKCDNDDQAFCKRRHVCLSKLDNCTEPEKFDFFSVSKFANQSGWASLCQVLVPFTARLEYGLRKCKHFLNRPNGTCRAKTKCPEDKEFCRRWGRCVPFGKCPSHPNSSHIPPHFISPQCNWSDFELSMIWEKEPLKKVFAPDQPPALVGLVARRKVQADLEFKLGGRNWKEYKGCGPGYMRVISTNSTLRLSSCAHGFVSFDIMASPDNSTHGQCVQIAASPGFTETVAMAVLPKLDDFVAGLDLAVLRPNVVREKSSPSPRAQFSSFVKVIHKPINCNVMKLNESLACRVPEVFRLRYKQAMNRLKGRQSGVVIVGINPPGQVRLSCYPPRQRRIQHISVGVFFDVDISCSFYPEPNLVDSVTVEVAPALKAPAPQTLNFNTVQQTDARRISEAYNSLSTQAKRNTERAIKEIVRRLSAASDSKLKRKIRNFVRSVVIPDKQESCKAANNEECSRGTKIGKLEVKVDVVNTRPILHLARGKNFVYFPPVPENASRIKGKCINVSILIGTSQKKMEEYIRKRKGSQLHERLAAGIKIADKSSPPLITDAEDRYPGLAIVGVSKQNKFGMWRFKLSGESFLRKMNLTSGSVLLLGPNDCIIFSAKNVSWRKKDARDLTFLKLRAWDRSDNRKLGYHQLNASLMDSLSAFSSQAVKCIVSKLGCDNVEGSGLQRDKCGVCAKRLKDRNKCLGCDGKPNSGKKRDECGDCAVPGQRSSNCFGSCKMPSYLDECGVCQINGSQVASAKDCNGECHGRALWSECRPRVCVGGNTSRPVNLGKDLCGKCGGKNGCVDCAGVVNGKKIWNSCQQCLDPDDKLFFKCPKIIDVNELVVNGDESTKLTLTVAGMKSNIRCYLEAKDSSRHELVFIKTISRKKVAMSTPIGLPRGNYSLKCTLGDSPSEIEFNEKILVYNKPRILSIYPEEAMVNSTIIVTLAGTDFVKTRSLHCVFFLERGKMLSFEALFVNATTITCSLNYDGRAQRGHVSVLFNRNAKRLAREIAKRFGFYDMVPEPKKCVFSKTRNYLYIFFDRDVDCGKGKWESCSNYFKAASLSKLTKKSQCGCRKGKLLVQNAPEFTLRPGDTVIVLLNRINRMLSGFTKHSTPQERNLTVEDFAKPVQFTVKLSAPEKVGVCDSFVVYLKVNQRAAVNWSATFHNTASVTPEQTADLAKLNARLANVSSSRRKVWFPSRELKIGVMYNVTVCGREVFQHQEACDTVAIRRVSNAIPRIMFPVSRIVIGPSIRIKFRAKVHAPSCLKRSKRRMVYLWTCDHQGLEFNDEKPTLNIKADQFSAGQDLTFTFTAFVRDDDSLRASAKLTIEVKKKDMIARIKGGERRVISAHNETVCDGGDSRDPNNLPGDPIYLWTCNCKHGDGWQPCLARNKTTGHVKLVVLPRTSLIRIPPDTFPADKICAVTMTLFKGNMSAKASVYFDVKAKEVPFVKIVKVFSKDKKVVFVASVKSSLSSLEIDWSCEQEDENGNSLDFDLKPLNITPFSFTVKKRPGQHVMRKRVSLVFRKLQDTSRVKCKCRVTGEDTEAFAEDEVKSDSPPIEGRCRQVDGTGNGGTAIEATDFEDPDGEALRYRCGYKKDNGKTSFVTSWSTSSSFEDLSFPSGEPANGSQVDGVVQARNTRGVTISTVCRIVVPPLILSKEDTDNFTEEIGELFDLNMPTEILAKGKQVLSASHDEEANEQILRKITEEAAAAIESDAEDDGSDREDKIEKLKTLEFGLFGDEAKQVEKGRKRLNASGVESNMFAKKLAKFEFGKKNKENDGGERRKRRSVDNNEEDVEQVDARTTEEVETTLRIYSATINPSDFSSSSMEVKQILVSLVDNLGRGLCQGLTTAEPALIAESPIVVLRSEKNSFDLVDTNFINIACENCTYAVQTTAQVLLGKSLKDRYETWDCDEDGCNGACVVSAQYPHDLLAPLDNTDSSISDVIYVKLFNSENAAPLSSYDLIEPATFRIPLKNYAASYDVVPACHTWDQSSLSWKIQGVTTVMTPSSGDGVLSVDCTSVRLGFVAVFAKKTSEKPVYVQFKLIGNYDDYITEASKEMFISKVTESVAEKVKVSVRRIANLTARPGSIFVSFILLQGMPGETEVARAVSTLKKLVTIGNFSMTLPDGRTLFAASDSFQSSATPITSSPSQTPVFTTIPFKEPIEASSKLSTGMLVGAIVGSVVGVWLFVFAVIMIARRRSTLSKVDDTSSEDNKTKMPYSPPPAYENLVGKEKLQEGGNDRIMADLQGEVDIQLPGTPYYGETETDRSRIA